MSDELNRVFLWCVPRTVSTAFAKCITSVDGLQVVSEPYHCAFRAGPESKFREPYLNSDPLGRRFMELHYHTQADKELPGYDRDVCTYAWIRDELLRASYEDKKLLFCKAIPHYLDAKYHMLPQNFKYSFLIRHPNKVFKSWKRNLLGYYGESAELSDLRKIPEYLFPPGYGFKELYELVEYVEKNLGQQPVIVDIDDLLADPPGIMSAYCHKMEIPYSPDLLSWEASHSLPDTWIVSKPLAKANKVVGFYRHALQSSGFRSPEPVPPFESLPADVQACVEASMGYYEKLRERRIKSN